MNLKNQGICMHPENIITCAIIAKKYTEEASIESIKEYELDFDYAYYETCILKKLEYQLNPQQDVLQKFFVYYFKILKF